MEEFLELRKWFFEQLDKILKSDVGFHHKSYEGTFRISFDFPCIFEEEKEPEVTIDLDCYVIGPNRHYTWYGETLSDSIALCRRDLEKWVNEALEEN